MVQRALATVPGAPAAAQLAQEIAGQNCVKDFLRLYNSYVKVENRTHMYPVLNNNE